MTTAAARARAHLAAGAVLRSAMVDRSVEEIVGAAAMIAECLRGGGKLLLCGNGGSAADCQHLATEFVARLSADFTRPALAAIALTTDSSLLTAYSNDNGFDGVFERQIEALGRPGDVVIAISASGGSANVLRAAAAAQRLGLRSLALCGEGGRLAQEADRAIVVPSRNTQLVQESLLAVEHLLCDLAERMLFDPGFQV